jgi:hypothetical protein
MKTWSPSSPMSSMGAEVGMIQRRSGLGLALAEHARAAGDVFRKKLQVYEVPQVRVFGLRNHAHPASARAFRSLWSERCFGR